MIVKAINKIIFLILFGLIISPAFSADIKGKVHLNEKWQPVLFLAAINAPENLNVASPDFIISKTLIKPDGSFNFENITLSEDPQFYRFYLVRNEYSGVEFNLKGDRNFVHLILDNSSRINFEADINSNSLTINSIEGDDRNTELLEFNKVYWNKKKQLDSNLSKAQREFLTIDIENYIRAFVDTCKNSMVGLFALYHIEEKETDFLRNSDFYFNFQKRIEKDYPNTSYTEKFDELLLGLIGFRELVCEIPGVIPKWKNVLLIVESILLFLLLPLLVFLIVRIKKSGLRLIKVNHSDDIESLTIKEKEILDLLAQGKSNKEIAMELFIELSTVKSHLSRIYKQLNVKGRKEAIMRNQLKNRH